jgi:hypothetical protein
MSLISAGSISLDSAFKNESLFVVLLCNEIHSDYCFFLAWYSLNLYERCFWLLCYSANSLHLNNCSIVTKECVYI